MLRTTALILFSLAWGLSASVVADDVALASRLRTALQELRGAGTIKTRGIEVEIRRGHVTLEGQVSSRAEAAIIAETLFRDEEIVEMHLHLAVGRRPSGPGTAEDQRKRSEAELPQPSPVWDDGDWTSRVFNPGRQQPNFGLFLAPTSETPATKVPENPVPPK